MIRSAAASPMATVSPGILATEDDMSEEGATDTAEEIICDPIPMKTTQFENDSATQVQASPSVRSAETITSRSAWADLYDSSSNSSAPSSGASSVTGPVH